MVDGILCSGTKEENDDHEEVRCEGNCQRSHLRVVCGQCCRGWLGILARYEGRKVHRDKVKIWEYRDAVGGKRVYSRMTDESCMITAAARLWRRRSLDHEESN